MSCISYAINGVPLDDPQGRWHLLKGTTVGLGAAVRAVSSTVPGLHGARTVPFEPVDEAQLVLQMSVTGNNFMALRANYSALAMLLAPSGDVVVERFMGGEVTSQIGRGRTIDTPEFFVNRRVQTFAATMRLPDVFWRGQESTWVQSSVVDSEQYAVSIFDGCTAPVTDALILIDGPVVNPRVRSGAHWFQLNLTLADGEAALVDCSTWTVRAGSGVTFAGGGQIKTGVLMTSGGSYLLHMSPQVLGTDPTYTKIPIALSATSGITGSTKLSVRGRPSHVG